MKNNLKMYCGYDKSVGSYDGAVLVFAHNAREARNLTLGSDCVACSDFTDVTADLLTGREFLRSEALQEGPHVVEDVKQTCKKCYTWGEELNAEGLCGSCQEDEKGE